MKMSELSVEYCFYSWPCLANWLSKAAALALRQPLFLVPTMTCELQLRYPSSGVWSGHLGLVDEEENAASKRIITSTNNITVLSGKGEIRLRRIYTEQWVRC